MSAPQVLHLDPSAVDRCCRDWSRRQRRRSRSAREPRPRRPRSRQAAAIGPLDPAVLPPGIRSRFVDGVNGLRMHVLEAGFETPGRPALLLRARLPRAGLQLAQDHGAARRGRLSRLRAGRARLRSHVAGAGRTTRTTCGRSASLNKIKDMLALVSAMGYRSVAAVIGHDQGSPLAGWCACARPDVFKAVAMMSAPFGGAPTLPFNTANAARAARRPRPTRSTTSSRS